VATIPSSRPQGFAVEEPVPLLSARWALTSRHFVVCLLLGVLFLYVSYRPLVNSQVWTDVSVGRSILQEGALPTTDALQPLSEGMRVIDTCWLAQILFAKVDAWGGPHAVAGFFALASLAYYAVLAGMFYSQTKRVGLTAAGVGFVVLFSAGPPAGASSEVFGLGCMAALIWVLMRLEDSGFPRLVPEKRGDQTSGKYWLAILILFALWANLHGSYLLGLLVLVCYTLARACHVAWTTRSGRAVLSDSVTQRWVFLTQAALVATLLNPYGLDLTFENLRLAFHEQIRQGPEWLPLSLASTRGVLFLASLVALALVLRHSRRRVRPVELLLLGVFACGVVVTGKSVGWYATVFAFVVVPHLADVVTRLIPKSGEREAPLTSASFRFTFSCGLVVYCSFVWSPFCSGFLGSKPRDVEKLLGDWAPCGVAQYLRENPSDGLIYAPVRWSDWLAYEGWPNTQVVMTSNVQWVPRRVWSDHLRMARCEEGWNKGMDRYGVQTLVIDKELQGSLVKSVERSQRYAVVYEDDLALVAQRVDDDRRIRLEKIRESSQENAEEVASL
jgi:hypothetical protein